MRKRLVLFAASCCSAVAVAGAVVGGTPASARPIDKGHFHDVFTSDVYDCDGIAAQDSGDVSGNFVFNQRGSSPFPYYRESVHGTVVTTNLNTGGTYTNVFTVNSRDHTIVDNGDGTITITVIATQTAYLIGGLVVIETLFNYPGLGRLIVTAANNKDFAMLEAGVLVIGIVYLGATLIADILYTILNPRIRFQQAD